MTKRIASVALAASLVAPTPVQAIRGGQPVPIGRVPWAVAVVKARTSAWYGQYCGGAVIAPRIVLTAAHCITQAAGQHEVVVGRSVLTQHTGRRIAVVREIAYPGFHPDGTGLDLGLLILAQPAGVRPVEIASRAEGVGGNADGWGITSPRDEMTSDSLRSAPVRLESGCQKAYGNSFNPRSELCVTGVACSGDSGSPLVVRGGIIGVASWGGGPSEPSGWGCSSSRYPSVYTRIPRSLNRPLLAGTL